MRKEEIHLDDIKRILLGNAPWEFLAEVVLRSIFIYLFLLIVVRLLGKRMSGQLTITEVAVMLVLGAIVSVPMQDPQRGILQGVLLLSLILIFQRGLTWLTYKSKKLEQFVQGSSSMLIKDGTILIKNKKEDNISDEQLFAILREKGIFNLGKVKRLYQEGCGEFSIYTNDQPAEGLSILPKADKAIHDTQQRAEALACNHCGYIIHSSNHYSICPNCGKKDWGTAVIE
jgi:uncharacterized membrane protein YcaP (DUF421 family)